MCVFILDAAITSRKTLLLYLVLAKCAEAIYSEFIMLLRRNNLPRQTSKSSKDFGNYFAETALYIFQNSI